MEEDSAEAARRARLLRLMEEQEAARTRHRWDVAQHLTQEAKKRMVAEQGALPRPLEPSTP